MKFGVREIADVVFKAIQSTKIGDRVFQVGEPVLYIDSAKTSTIEGAATTVYAQGGRGNSRLIAWEGEKTLTFTVEDALLSEVGFAILSGAGLFNIPDNDDNKKAMVHKTEVLVTNAEGELTIRHPNLSTKAPIFVMGLGSGSLSGKISNVTVEAIKDTVDTTKTVAYKLILPKTAQYINTTVLVDYYLAANVAVTELQIDAEHFAGYYYVEGSTKFRRESDGKDLDAKLTFPKVKIQSNFTFNMSSTGDPSTFTFTMDALPGYTMFESTKKVLLAMQIINEIVGENSQKAVTAGKADADILKNDSILDWTDESFFDFIKVDENNNRVEEGGAE